MKGVKSKPVDTKLYNQVKKEAKSRFRSWPSAYASGWLVKEYKRRGGKYSKSKTSKKQGLSRWYKYEKWINVCELPRIVPCGASSKSKKRSRNYWAKFPYCRPMKRATSKSPVSAFELSKSEIKRRCTLKRKAPKKRLSRTKRRS